MVQDNIPAVGAAGYTLLSELDDLTWDSWISLADMATAMNTKAASQGAIFANGITTTYITASGIALIFNHANLTAANAAAICNETGLAAAVLNSICDNANISTATIKAILDIETVTVASQLGAMLEGTQLSLANAATVCNDKYTDAQKAAAFNNAIMSAARSASIFNEAGFTPANKALVCREAGLSIANINAIIIHANITDDNAQQILSEITKANRDLTSAANIHEILDDWNDNKLTSRDGAGTASTGFTNLFAHKDKFRPEWTTEAGSPSVSGGELVLPLNAKVSIASTFEVGTWEWISRHSATGGDSSMLWGIMWTDISNKITYTHAYISPYLRLQKRVGGGITDLITDSSVQPTTNTAYKITRDVSGNYEIFFGGVSKGTVTDTYVPASWTKIHFGNAHTAGPTIYTDDFKVY